VLSITPLIHFILDVSYYEIYCHQYQNIPVFTQSCSTNSFHLDCEINTTSRVREADHNCLLNAFLSAV